DRARRGRPSFSVRVDIGDHREVLDRPTVIPGDLSRTGERSTMAQEPRRKKSPNQLSAEIARSRELVERDLRAVRAELDIPRKIRRSFRTHTGAWIPVAALIGVVLVIRTTRKKKIYVRAKA